VVVLSLSSLGFHVHVLLQPRDSNLFISRGSCCCIVLVTRIGTHGGPSSISDMTIHIKGDLLVFHVFAWWLIVRGFHVLVCKIVVD